MLKSMTGYGCITHETDSISITVEIKTINSKSQDFSLRLPKVWMDKEIEVKNKIAKELDRGKVSLSVDVVRKNTVQPGNFKINERVFEAYVTEIRSKTAALGVSEQDILRFVLSQPDVIESNISTAPDEAEWEAISHAIDQALEACNSFRKQEGKILAEMLMQYIEKIRKDLAQIIALDPERILKLREKLKNKLEEYVQKEQLDQSRFEQEVLYYIEKLDIEEEKVRLKAHLDYFESTIHQVEAVGKKLGFIAQEIGREINTIGSKCNESHMQRLVVSMKEELEKIKEQSMNVL